LKVGGRRQRGVPGSFGDRFSTPDTGFALCAAAGGEAIGTAAWTAFAPRRPSGGPVPESSADIPASTVPVADASPPAAERMRQKRPTPTQELPSLAASVSGSSSKKKAITVLDIWEESAAGGFVGGVVLRADCRGAIRTLRTGGAQK